MSEIQEVQNLLVSLMISYERDTKSISEVKGVFYERVKGKGSEDAIKSAKLKNKRAAEYIRNLTSVKLRIHLEYKKITWDLNELLLSAETFIHQSIKEVKSHWTSSEIISWRNQAKEFYLWQLQKETL